MAGYGPDERALFESASSPLFESIVDQGGIAVDDPRIADGGAERPAFDLLVELASGRRSSDPG